jgi:hypothetical protein
MKSIMPGRDSSEPLLARKPRTVPTGRLHDGRDGRAARTAQQRQHRFLLGPGASIVMNGGLCPLALRHALRARLRLCACPAPKAWCRRRRTGVTLGVTSHWRGRPVTGIRAAVEGRTGAPVGAPWRAFRPPGAVPRRRRRPHHGPRRPLIGAGAPAQAAAHWGGRPEQRRPAGWLKDSGHYGSDDRQNFVENLLHTPSRAASRRRRAGAGAFSGRGAITPTRRPENAGRVALVRELVFTSAILPTGRPRKKARGDLECQMTKQLLSPPNSFSLTISSSTWTCSVSPRPHYHGQKSGP